MEQEEDPPTQPFWLQPSSKSRRRFWPRLPSSAFFVQTGFLVPILCILSIVILVFLSPFLISLKHQVFRPSSVRKSWDSVNLVLILFAIVCGFLVRKDKDDDQTIGQLDVDNSPNVSLFQSQLMSHQEYNICYDYEFSDQAIDVPKLRRTSSSYPDLRQEYSWGIEYDHRPRYYDDSYSIKDPRPPRSLRSIGSFQSQKETSDDYIEEGDDTLTTCIQKESTLYYSKARKSRRELDAGQRVRKAKEPPPPLPLPLPPPPPQWTSHREYDETLKKSATQSKRKTKLLRRKSYENLRNLPPPTPPQTPPQPPPPYKTHNNFSPKKPKISKRATSSAIITYPTPTTTNFNHIYETTLDGYESPAIPIPPPPPPPPFKLPPWRFAVHGDYVKVNSSPKRGGRDESEFDDDATMGSPVAGHTAPPPEFCPSIDVNTKADDFIARFKANLKLEKINSIKMKDGLGNGLAPLGPDSSPNPSPHAMAVSGLF